MIAERRDVAAEGLQAGLLRLQEWPGMESGRLATGPMATTPRSIVAPAPIKRKHLALRSPRGGFDTTPRAATKRAAPKVPAPPMQPREAGTQASASGRSCATGSTRRSTARPRISTQRCSRRSASAFWCGALLPFAGLCSYPSLEEGVCGTWCCISYPELAVNASRWLRATLGGSPAPPTNQWAVCRSMKQAQPTRRPSAR